MIESAQLGPPIDVRGLFPRERAVLLALLGELTAGDWNRATVCPGWSVKDVDVHPPGPRVDRELLAAVLDTFLRAIPFTLRNTAAEAGTQLRVEVTGAPPMWWAATRRDRGWFLDSPPGGPRRRLNVCDTNGA